MPNYRLDIPAFNRGVRRVLTLEPLRRIRWGALMRCELCLALCVVGVFILPDHAETWLDYAGGVLVFVTGAAGALGVFMGKM